MTVKFKKRLKFLTYNFVVVVVIFLCLEGYIGYVLSNPASAPNWLYAALKTYHRERDWNIIQMDSRCAQYDSSLFYTLKPGSFQFENREFTNDFKVNRLGLRDDEKSLNMPKAIVLGDSYAMGWGVEQNETFAELIEDSLGFPVLNAGISSYGTAREIKSLEKIETDSLKYLIIQYCENDRVENQNFILNNESLTIEKESVYQKMSEDHESRLGYYPFKHILNLPSYFNPNTDLVKKMQNEQATLLAKIHAELAFINILKASGKIPAQTKILIFSISAESCGDEFITQINSLLAKDFTSSMADQISTISLSGLIDSTHRYTFDPHLNSLGHQVIATQIMEGIDLLKNTLPQKVWFYDSGDTSVICNYKNGLKHGRFIGFWPNGVRSIETTYVNGEKLGHEYLFDEMGDTIQSNWNVKFK